jgi:hypothetical protein
LSRRPCQSKPLNQSAFITSSMRIRAALSWCSRPDSRSHNSCRHSGTADEARCGVDVYPSGATKDATREVQRPDSRSHSSCRRNGAGIAVQQTTHNTVLGCIPQVQ